MVEKRYRLTIELLEDLHSGAGTGSGDIDALQMRDRRGRPVLRASHLKGVMLAEGEELVKLNQAAAADVQALLGRSAEGRGILRMTSARLHRDSEGETLLWTSAARAPGERRPLDGTMRIVEHVAAGNVLSAELRMPANPPLEALLARLTRRIDRLGANRNRGAGLVRVCIADETEAATGASARTTIARPTSRLRLRLRNIEPLCLPDTGHPANLISSLPFVRGQTLRGALTAWAIARNDQDALALLRRVSIGDALPLPCALDGQPPGTLQVMPIPLSIMTPKPAGGSATSPWWASNGGRGAAAFDDLGPSGDAEERPKRPGAREFLARSVDGEWLRYTPPMGVHLRNQTADFADMDVSGMPVTEPQLFSIEEIAEDTRFLAELGFDDPDDAPAFVRCFAAIVSGGQWLALGRGGQPVEIEAIADAAASVNGSHGDDWTLTLLSDTIVRGDHLGFLTDLDVPSLARIASTESSEDWTMRGFADTVRLHGFNAASGLRRKSALAIRRGSCWRIEGPGSSALAAALAKLPAIGERTNEGCGRFVIGAQPIDAIAGADSEQVPLAVNDREALLAAGAELAGMQGALSPSLSQLQWLRSSALAAADQKDLDELLTEIATAGERRPQGGAAWKRFPVDDLRHAMGKLSTLDERRQLVSGLVEWLAPRAKAKAQEKHS